MAPTSSSRPSSTPAAAADKPYSSFTQRQKYLIVLCATLGGLFSPFTTQIYFPALSTIAADLNVSISQVNLTVTTYMIFQAVVPSFISSITDTQGRRPTYVLGFLVYTVANLGLALNNTYAGLLVLRCIQSAGSSGLVVLQQAIIADIVTSAERGSYISITSINGIVAPSVAPIVGGLLAQHLGWHSIFWFLLIMSGVYVVPLMLWFPETARKLVGDGSIPPPPLNRSLWYIIKQYRHRDRTHSTTNTTTTETERPKRKFTWPSPLGTLAIVVELEAAVLLTVLGIVYAVLYAVMASLSTQFHDIYGLDSTMQGLIFLTIAAGTILSAFTNSVLLDRNYRRHALKMGLDPDRKKQIAMQGFPIERVRLEIGLPFFIVGSFAVIAYGWMLDYQVHIAGPIVMLVIIGYTTLAGFNTLSVLLIDLYRSRAAAAIAAANLVRCLLGAGMTAVVNPMIIAMGLGWCFTFTALVQLATLPLLWVCMKYGVTWRELQAAKEGNRGMQP
ncbi:putative MFS transporter [Exophiala viscosa]|uniref:putative MFS transporter n=1 Tax=Exophiala viscosa TaxID=2486360 RepID=UPI00218CCCE3|nr:putative MFS transporter [Exophiala viscosa]